MKISKEKLKKMKDESDKLWKKIYDDVVSGISVDKKLIYHSMERCNIIDNEFFYKEKS